MQHEYSSISQVLYSIETIVNILIETNSCWYIIRLLPFENKIHIIAEKSRTHQLKTAGSIILKNTNIETYTHN